MLDDKGPRIKGFERLKGEHVWKALGAALEAQSRDTRAAAAVMVIACKTLKWFTY